MSHLRIEVDGTELFDAEVEGWTPPPVLPANPTHVKADQLPKPVRELLARAAAQAFETATGFKVEIKV